MLRLSVLFVALFSPMVLWGHEGHDHHVDSKKAGPHSHASVVILNEQNWDHYVPQGKEVDAIYGDAVLKNAYLTAVIANPVATRNANMTVRNVGGSLIDLTSNSDSSDQLSCFYPLQRAYVFDILKTQQSQSETIVNGQKTSASQAEVLVEAKVAKNGVKVTQVYRLNSDDRFLTLVTRFVNTTEKKIEVNLAEDLRADGGKENMVYRPNGVGPMHWFADQFWGQAYAIIPETGWSVRSTSNSRTHQLVYQRENNPDGKVEIAAGGTFEFLRKIYPGKDLVEVQSHLALDRGVALHPVELAVKNAAGDSVAHAMVNIVGVEGINGNSRSDSHGHVNFSLPAGTFRIKAEVQGQKLLENEPATIEVAKNHHSDQRFHLPLAMWKPGTVQARFTDESGNPIACKVEFVGINGTASPYFGPETAEFGVMNLRYAPHGQFDQELAAGDYEVIVSHGAEYNAIFKKIKIDAGVKTRLEGKLVRSVQTPGWISADYHSHSSPSGDNTGSQLGRVLNLVAEHIEFAPCTEHNRIETYEPEIAELKIQHAIATVSGMEMTGSPLPLNHQNVFPLIYKPRTQDGGGPTADPDPTTQILRLLNWDNRSEKLIQQNHPDIGWLFYDKNGDQKPDGGYSGSLGVIDVMEIHPIDMVTTFKPTALENGRESTNQMFAWLQLLNQGYRIPGVVNTDAHYNFHGSGGLRNWVQSSTDDPAKIDPMEMVRASEQGRVIMSNGPYLEFQVRESGKEKVAVSGEDLSAPSKKIRVSLRVQCPDWTDINRVFLLVNGRVLSSHDYRKTNQADKFQSGTVKFEQEFDISLEQDAHLIAVAVGEGLKLGPVMGPAWGQQMPSVVANPIFVDVDGNGFSPNKDTLGYPLPVKFVAK